MTDWASKLRFTETKHNVILSPPSHNLAPEPRLRGELRRCRAEDLHPGPRARGPDEAGPDGGPGLLPSPLQLLQRLLLSLPPHRTGRQPGRTAARQLQHL